MAKPTAFKGINLNAFTYISHQTKIDMLCHFSGTVLLYICYYNFPNLQFSKTFLKESSYQKKLVIVNKAASCPSGDDRILVKYLPPYGQHFE